MDDAGHESKSLREPVSPLSSTFSASNLLPRATGVQYREGLMSHTTRGGSTSPASVFDIIEEGPEYHTQATTTAPNSGAGELGLDEPGEYDLKPPLPSATRNNVETLSGRFFSVDHLNIILRDYAQSNRFSKFLKQYKPHLLPSLSSYTETQKAVAAVEYANAIASRMQAVSGQSSFTAARLDQAFEQRAHGVVEDLVSEALPAYVTHRLVQLVTDSLVKEITGNSAPLMREMIPSLAEVYCVSDPSLPDNPIVYASEEFYNTSQYGKDYVIGRNCRFLQGPQTSGASVKRLIDALAAGQEIIETILNYRRDGSPFMNLLMIAPLYDNKGTVRYFLGCQIDVSQLVENGRGLESFSQLLARDRSDSRFGGRPDRKPMNVLSEFGSLLSDEETDVVKRRARSYSQESDRSNSQQYAPNRGGRRILGMDDGASDRALWPHPSLGPSGRLPGVYQNYLLVRPYPSLRITFTSPALRIPGLLQTKFLDRVGGPQNVREGILDSLAHGTAVTAKISWITNIGEGQAPSEGKPRWIHCTPLLGSDDRVGVWMVVMVESEEVTGSLNRLSIDAQPGNPVQQGAANPRFTGNKLYNEYMRREGKVATPINGSVNSRTSSAQQQRGGRNEPQPFQDF